MFDFLVGLDLGQVSDYSAITVAERPLWIGPPPEGDLSGMWPPNRLGWTRPSELLPVWIDHFRRQR